MKSHTPPYVRTSGVGHRAEQQLITTSTFHTSHVYSFSVLWSSEYLFGGSYRKKTEMRFIFSWTYKLFTVGIYQ